MAEKKVYEYEIKKEDFVKTTKDGVDHFVSENDHVAEIKKSIFGEDAIKEFEEKLNEHNDKVRKAIVEIATEQLNNGTKELVVTYKEDGAKRENYVKKDGDDVTVISKFEFENRGPKVEDITNEIKEVLANLK